MEIKYNLDNQEIVRLYTKELWTINKIAKFFCVNHGTIKLRLEKENVVLRSHKENQKIVMSNPSTKAKISKSSKQSNQKRAQTNLNKYGHVVPANNPTIRSKWQQKSLNEHGYIWGNQRPETRKKYKNTCMEKYDVDNVSKLSEVRKKISNKRWKEKTDIELKEIQRKSTNTLLRNYNVTNPLLSPVIIARMRNNNLQKYDVDWVTKLDNVKQKIRNTYFQNMKEKILKRLKQLNLELIDEYQSCTDFIKLKCRKCNTEFQTVLDYVFHGYGLCPTCFPSFTSNFFEKEIFIFLQELLPNVEIFRNTKRILESKKELDIYIPSKQIALECNGLYWHSDDLLKNKYYHLQKTEECIKHNIFLIQIFEDEWYLKKEIVKNRLQHIFGYNTTNTIYARNCNIKVISSQMSNSFLETFHIQGSDNSTIKLGAFYNNELVSVMTFGYGNIAKGSKVIEGVWELNRFATKYNVVGIAGKLLEHFKRNYEWKEIFSYADRRWSNGNLYEQLGFTLDHITKPNYWYVKGYKRIHRFNLRKRKDEPKDIPEWILRQNQGYTRIWDCGNLRFKLERNSLFLDDKKQSVIEY